MADLEAVRFVESYKLERFITDGLNSGKFGYDAVEILSEIYVLERYDVAPVVRASWEYDDPVSPNKHCSNCGESADLDDDNYWSIETPYCKKCGAKMDGEEKR